MVGLNKVLSVLRLISIMVARCVALRCVAYPTIPDHRRPSLPQDWRFATHPKTAIAIISGTAKSYGLHIWPIHSQGPSELVSPRKILEKRERGRIQGLPNIVFSTSYYLRNG